MFLACAGVFYNNIVRDLNYFKACVDHSFVVWFRLASLLFNSS